MMWNNGSHRRKFLKCPGEFVDRIQNVHHNELRFSLPQKSELLFWGEMEFPTAVHKINNPEIDSKYPHYIHEPIAQKRLQFDADNEEQLYKLYGSAFENDGTVFYDASMGYQNTDPYVFGDYFSYSCCKQNRNGKPVKLQRLLPGDVIIYYSTEKNSFMIDTVFVVGEVVGRYKRNYYDEIKPYITEMYNQTVILPALYGSGLNIDNKAEFTLYHSATYNNPVNGMFSYFPCRLSSEGFAKGFPRFELCNGKLTDDIQIKQKQGFGILETKGQNHIKDIWMILTEQITQSGFLLGIQADEPQFI